MTYIYTDFGLPLTIPIPASSGCNKEQLKNKEREWSSKGLRTWKLKGKIKWNCIINETDVVLF